MKNANTIDKFIHSLNESHNTRTAATFLTSIDSIYEALEVYSDKWDDFDSVVETLYKAFGKNRERAKQFLICARKATGKISATEAVAEYVTGVGKGNFTENAVLTLDDPWEIPVTSYYESSNSTGDSPVHVITEGTIDKFIHFLKEAKSLSFSMDSLALALEDVMPFAHPKCKLIKVFGKKQILTSYMPCFDYFGNDPYNPRSKTDNSFMVSLYHGAHQRLYIFNDDEMTEWNIEIDNEPVATVSYNDVNTLAHTIKELFYKNWPEKMKEAEYFVERKWEEGKRKAQEYIEMIDRSLADCNNDWSEYGRKNAGKDADWFVNKIKKNYADAEKTIGLCNKFMPTIKFTESKHMKGKLKESISSPSCWEDWHAKMMRLAAQDADSEAMVASVENIDEIHEKVGEFKNMDASDIEKLNDALDCLAGAENYELYTAFEDMCDYFGFNELQESKKGTRKRVKESYDSDCRTSVKAMFYNHDRAEIEAMVEEINDIHNTTFFTRELGKKIYIESGTLFTSIAKLEDVLEEFVQRGATEVNFIKA